MKINNFCIAIWKMNLDVDECLNFLKKFNSFKNVHAGTKVVICPSYASIYPCINNDNTFGLSWGAQDISNNFNGAFTGEVSPKFLLDTGCEYVIIGHSERRTLNKESNKEIKLRAQSAINNNLKVIQYIFKKISFKRSKTTKLKIMKRLNIIIFYLFNISFLKSLTLPFGNSCIWLIDYSLINYPTNFL